PATSMAPSAPPSATSVRSSTAFAPPLPHRSPMARASWLDRLDDRAELAAAALVLAATVLVFAGVVMRNLFTTSPSWIAELPVHFIVWAIFLALAASFSRGAELGLDILVRRLPPAVQRALDRLGALAMLLIAVMLV